MFRKIFTIELHWTS